LKNIIESSKRNASKIADTGDYYEAGEFLYSVTELLDKIRSKRKTELYDQIIEYWEKQIDNFKQQAKLHEISELYLRIAELYHQKYHNSELEREYIQKSIQFLDQESGLLETFNELRKLAQNYQNIAELYLKIGSIHNSIKYYLKVINISKKSRFLDLLSYSYHQIAYCYEQLDDYESSKEIILDGIDHFSKLNDKYEEKNENLAIAQTSQILKHLYQKIGDQDQYSFFSKKEAGAYINLAEYLEKCPENYQKISRYYRGAALCYRDIDENLIEAASCFVLAGSYSQRSNDYNGAAVNYYDAAIIFKNLEKMDLCYKNFIKAGDNFWNDGNVNRSTESFLDAYDIAVESELEFNRYGIFNQIIRGLNKIAKEGLKSKQFYTAATLILESIKFYEKLETAEDFLLKDMVKNVYRYYYRAANLKKIGHSHIVNSYIIAALSCVLIGKIEKANEILEEIGSEGKTISLYKRMVEKIISWRKRGEKVEISKFPFKIRRLLEGSEDILYLINLFKKM
jgi:tetratricopeptide (TPR) repeat protein